MATKRRNVLLRRDDGGMAHFPAWTVVSWPAEPKDRNETIPVITFVERLPGDVVLSREQADLICRRLNDLYDVTVQDKHEIRALLRGRR